MSAFQEVGEATLFSFDSHAFLSLFIAGLKGVHKPETLNHFFLSLGEQCSASTDDKPKKKVTHSSFCKLKLEHISNYMKPHTLWDFAATAFLDLV